MLLLFLKGMCHSNCVLALFQRLGRQSGYGFVHFTCDQNGIESAFKAVNAVDNNNISNVVYNVELSKNLLKLFGEYQQKQQLLGNTGGASPASPSNAASINQEAAAAPGVKIPNLSAPPSVGLDGADQRYAQQRRSHQAVPPATSTFQHGRAGHARTGGPLRPASFHDLNSVRNAAAFQQQVQQHQLQQFQQQQYSPAQLSALSQQSQYQQYQSVHQFPQAPQLQMQTQPPVPPMIQTGFAPADNLTSDNLDLTRMLQRQNSGSNAKLLATRSASRLTNLPPNSVPNAFNPTYPPQGLMNGRPVNGQSVNFAHSPSNATVQYDYRTMGAAGPGRKYTFDGSHSETVALEGQGSLSKFNSSDSYEKSHILASQSSDVFRTLAVKSNSFMTNSQGSMFSLTESNVQQQASMTATKSLKRGNSNMSEVSIDTELEVTRISLDQKMLGSKELDDFLFSTGASKLNSLGSEEGGPLSLGARSDITSSPTKIRDGIASRTEEKKMAGLIPPIGSPMAERRSAAHSTAGSESDYSTGYRSRQDSLVNSGNVSRVGSFNRNNGSGGSGADASLNFSSATSALDELRGGDDELQPSGGISALSGGVASYHQQQQQYQHQSPQHQQSQSLRYALEQMSIGSPLDSVLEFPMTGN